MKLWIVWLCGVLCLGAGCASHEVHCDGRLQPINPPATLSGTTRGGPATRRLP